jgi:glyoxylase-like metal-dependent hydrolase (beta-lactamase superfamily II)
MKNARAVLRGWRAATAIAAATVALTAGALDPLVPIRVAPGIYYVQGKAGTASAANEGFNSNAGFVVTTDGVVAIDALGTPALGEALIRAIATVTPKPVKRLILTHYHADHFYGAIAFKRAGAQIWAHRAAQAYLESGEPERRREQRARELFPWVDERMPIVRPDRWLDEATPFTFGGVAFEVRHAGPAHSPEDLIVVLPREGVVFAGDILFAGRIPFVGDADSRQWLARIEQLAALKPRYIVTGHGPISTDPARDLALTRDYLVYLRAAMGKAVEDFVPFEQAYAATDWSRFATVPVFEAANRVNAYGTYLLMERELLRK